MRIWNWDRTELRWVRGADVERDLPGYSMMFRCSLVGSGFGWYCVFHENLSVADFLAGRHGGSYKRRPNFHEAVHGLRMDLWTLWCDFKRLLEVGRPFQ